eukprot:CAMPEP_0178718222 /NCGR_PEP_ID=MMETSP0699-20121125/22402_1 /TAXON_ID=265572 /ORGANISM="Extubocellulus spinifer, Strain CCMP396" /LENGTH=690 /DNA_ID=CAMNT_0020368229 /DNA_START=30 /DNA_END=2099 /DNA_ORIENTATION=-
MAYVDARDDSGSCRPSTQGPSQGDHRIHQLRDSESGKCILYDALQGITDQLSPSLKRTLKFVSLRVAKLGDDFLYGKSGRTIVPGQIFLLCECNCPLKDRCYFPQRIKKIYYGVMFLVTGHLRTCDKFKSGVTDHEASPFGIKRSEVGKDEWTEILQEFLVDGDVIHTKPLSLSDVVDTATTAHTNGPSEDSAGEKENVSPNSQRDAVSCALENLSLVDMKRHIESSRRSETRKRTRSQHRCGGHGLSCAVCNRGELPFAPLVLYCMNCSTRIRQDGTYYCSDTFTCCRKCYKKLDSNVTLMQKKNDAEPQNERWKQCENSTCNKWVHFSCGLINPIERHGRPYSCPLCLVEDLEGREEVPVEAPSSFPCANDIPHTDLSRRLEECVLPIFHREVQRLATNVIGGPVSIRQLSSTKQVVEVGKGMLQRYKQQPTLPFRSKAIVAFQNIDGVDVIVFVLYVHEFDGECPSPNQNTVYISYLDSVRHLRPLEITSVLYQELIICYLDFARTMGITRAVVWSCPPLEGNDYILHVKPKTQKIPDKKRLLKWYYSILDECKLRGICREVRTVFDQYLRDPHATATHLPYFKGDYIPDAIEEIIATQGNDTEQDDAGLMCKLAEDFVQKGMKEDIIVAFLSIASEVKDTGINDCNDDIDIKVFNDRESFIDMCQKNNWQFDNLQRAKHSSMMILW